MVFEPGLPLEEYLVNPTFFVSQTSNPNQHMQHILDYRPKRPPWLEATTLSCFRLVVDVGGGNGRIVKKKPILMGQRPRPTGCFYTKSCSSPPRRNSSVPSQFGPGSRPVERVDFFPTCRLRSCYTCRESA